MDSESTVFFRVEKNFYTLNLATSELELDSATNTDDLEAEEHPGWTFG